VYLVRGFTLCLLIVYRPICMYRAGMEQHDGDRVTTPSNGNVQSNDGIALLMLLLISVRFYLLDCLSVCAKYSIGKLMIIQPASLQQNVKAFIKYTC
jgi:hypothetical protein